MHIYISRFTSVQTSFDIAICDIWNNMKVPRYENIIKVFFFKYAQNEIEIWT